jgi:DDE superfamily endonuclease
MSRHVLDGPDRSNWDRFVTASPWELPALNRAWRRFLRRELRRLKPSGTRIGGRQVDFLIFDDTDHPRTGPCLEGANYHYVHSRGSCRFGHCLVTGVYVAGDYPFAYSCDPYLRQADVTALNVRWAARGKEQRLTFHSKTELVVAQIDAFVPLRPGREVFLLLDSWYVNQQTVRAARRKGLSWCGALKSNRVASLLDLSLETGEVRSEQKTTIEGLLAEALSPQQSQGYVVGKALQQVTIGERLFEVTSYRARLPQLGIVQLGIVRERYRDGRYSPFVALATNRIDLSAAEVVAVYLRRWAIEVLHRDLKQNLGLTDCQVRPLEGTVRHWTLVFLSQGILTLLRLRADQGEVRTASGQVVPRVGKTLGEVRQFVQQCAVVELLRWACEQALAGQSIEEIAARLQLPA